MTSNIGQISKTSRVSAFLHRSGIRLCCYLDDWLIQVSSREQVLLALDTVLHLCHLLGIVVNWEKSQIVRSQRMMYLGVLLHSLFQSFSCPKESREASLDWLRILVMRRAASIILARALKSAIINDSARSGRSSSDAVSAIGSSACLGPMQPVVSCQLDSGDLSGSGVVAGSISTGRRDFSRSGVPSARLVVRCLELRLGVSSGGGVAFGLRLLEEAELSINARELLAVEYGLRFFAPQISNSTVTLFANNSTAISYLRNQGGIRSLLLSYIAQRILRWAESLQVVLAPQFIMGHNNVLADSLSRPNQILGSEWTLNTKAFQDLRKKWPVSINLFATSLNQQCCPYFSPFHDPNALGTDTLLQSMLFFPGLSFWQC